ncbi:uncharacterized protein LOC135583640 isoform X1 [Musa acuminata AAA Group]|uniref:uncharacterized protein LOC135583640 isoform X1 n=1 Tax=Musa acuminata AAA Group TaxID=214697 RepID=UPI0031E17FCA
MPSGAKKRKAARRKKVEETEQGLGHPPDSPTNASPDNNHDGKEKTSSSSSSSSSSDEEVEQEERREPAAAVEMEDNATGNDDGEKLEEVAVPVSTEAGVVSVEFLKAEKSEVAVEESAAAAATAVTVVLIDAPVPVDEEVVEAAEAATGTLVTWLEIDSLTHETDAKPAAALEETPVSESPRPSGELCHSTENIEPTPAPVAELRASWWNCCGLFDVLTASKDSIRSERRKE